VDDVDGESTLRRGSIPPILKGRRQEVDAK
jgi:hypothetical protein